MLVRTFY